MVVVAEDEGKGEEEAREGVDEGGAARGGGPGERVKRRQVQGVQVGGEVGREEQQDRG